MADCSVRGQVVVPGRLTDVHPLPVEEVVRHLPAAQPQGDHLGPLLRHQERPPATPVLAARRGRPGRALDQHLQLGVEVATQGRIVDDRDAVVRGGVDRKALAQGHRDGVTQDEETHRAAAVRPRLRQRGVLGRRQAGRERELEAAPPAASPAPPSRARARQRGQPEARHQAGGTQQARTPDRVTPPASSSSPALARAGAARLVVWPAAAARSPSDPSESVVPGRLLRFSVAAGSRAAGLAGRRRSPPPAGWPRSGPICPRRPARTTPACRAADAAGGKRPSWTWFHTQAPASMVGGRPRAAVMKAAAYIGIAAPLHGGRGGIGGDHHRVDLPHRQRVAHRRLLRRGARPAAAKPHPEARAASSTWNPAVAEPARRATPWGPPPPAWL